MTILAATRWRVRPWILWPAALLFLGIDAAYLSANLVKFMEGAWFRSRPGLGAFTVMRTWRRGRDLVRTQVNRDSLRIEHFLDNLMVDPPLRVPAPPFDADNDYLPAALLRNLRSCGAARAQRDPERGDTGRADRRR